MIIKKYRLGFYAIPFLFAHEKQRGAGPLLSQSARTQRNSLFLTRKKK